MRNRIYLLSTSFITSFALLCFGIVSAPSSTALECKKVKPTGKTIGEIKVGAVELPIKAFNYPEGGVMEPQATTLAAGLSKRHMPLSSNLGTSVITWHVNYNGCWNELNILMSQKPGYKFKVTDENGVTRTYKIDKKITVKKGNYQDSWFTLISPRKLTLVTCTGSFKNGHYTENMVFLASPVS